MAVEVLDSHSQVVIRVHEPAIRGHDAVPVGVGIVAGRDVVGVLRGDQRGHRVRRGAVHPDLAVPVQRHRAPGRVDQRVDDGQVEPVPLGDRVPVVDAGAAQRIGADPHPGVAYRVEVEHRRQVVDVRGEVVVGAGGVRGPGAGQRDAPDAGEAVAQVRVGGVLHGRCGLAARRPAVRRVVLEAAVIGRVVRRGDHDAIGQAGRAAPVVRQHRVRQGGRRGVAVAAVDQDGDPIGGEHLERGRPGRLGQRVGVPGEKQRAVGPAQVRDRLAGRGDVVVVEGGGQRGPAVPGGAERDLLRGVGGVRMPGVVGRYQVRYVDEVLRLGERACAVVDGHGLSRGRG